ncbi:hypothetical protein [Fusibacter sp. 3D3]|uniref:hypothetical protein n=1 Tax=Fusibacter sp. 3D3 TaxID=1048380 RepID=UPI000A06975A|nr:hypothetical protein [Fusibacter sp. 3D3]
MLNKSPSGSLCPYYYMGGELHPLKYGSYFNEKELLLSIMEEEEQFILNSTGRKNGEFGLIYMKQTLMTKSLRNLLFICRTLATRYLSCVLWDAYPSTSGILTGGSKPWVLSCSIK